MSCWEVFLACAAFADRRYRISLRYGSFLLSLPSRLIHEDWFSLGPAGVDHPFVHLLNGTAPTTPYNCAFWTECSSAPAGESLTLWHGTTDTNINLPVERLLFRISRSIKPAGFKIRYPFTGWDCRVQGSLITELYNSKAITAPLYKALNAGTFIENEIIFGLEGPKRLSVASAGQKLPRLVRLLDDL